MRTVTLETAVAELLRDIHDADHKHCVDVETIARAYSAICAGPDETICVVAGDKTASEDYLDGRPVVVAAAPEMLAACKAMVLAFDQGDAGDELHACKLLRAAIAKAEPPRSVKHRVNVTVEVEVETDPGEASELGNVIMSAIEAVRDGEGTVVAHEIV